MLQQGLCARTNFIPTSSPFCILTPESRQTKLRRIKTDSWLTKHNHFVHKTRKKVPRYSSPKDPLPIFLPSLYFPPITCSMAPLWYVLVSPANGLLVPPEKHKRRKRNNATITNIFYCKCLQFPLQGPGTFLWFILPVQNVAACWHHNASSDKQPYCLPSNSNAGRHQIAPWEPQTKRNPNQQLPLAPPMPTFHSGNTFPSGGASTAALERGEQGERNTRGIRSQQETRSGSGRRSGASLQSQTSAPDARPRTNRIDGADPATGGRGREVRAGGRGKVRESERLVGILFSARGPRKTRLLYFQPGWTRRDGLFERDDACPPRMRWRGRRGS
jgi:hypothetical protein